MSHANNGHQPQRTISSCNTGCTDEFDVRRLFADDMWVLGVMHVEVLEDSNHAAFTPKPLVAESTSSLAW